MLDRLCDQGRYLEGLRRLEAGGQLESWRGVRACGAVRRIAASVGAERIALRQAVRAWRTDPESPAARFVYGLEYLQHRGVLGWVWASRKWPAPRAGSASETAELLALDAIVAMELRDFARAEALVGEAESLLPGSVWVRLQRAALLERQDLVEAALEATRVARAVAPGGMSRAGVQREAHYLQLLGREEEAIAVLAGAQGRMESSAVAGQWLALLTEKGRWEEALQAADRFLELSPRLEPSARRGAEGRRAEILYRLGRRGEAAEAATRAGDPFHAEFATRLGQPAGAGDRGQLDVPFVRQHFKTCAPATLAALGRYWGMPADHVTLVEAVCYDGTPAHVQRAWAEAHDWRAVEFRVTWEAAVALLERGVPFAISTVEATSAHMQAVIGFDRVRGTLILRDPGRPHALEVAGEPFLACFRAFGPVGTVFLPRAQEGRLAGLDLPEAGAMTERYHLEKALAGHLRTEAAAALERLRALDGTGDRALFGACSMARYDGDPQGLGEQLDRLLERHPGNGALLLGRLGSLSGATRERRLAFLEAACGGKAKEPALLVELAGLLMEDARHREGAERWLKQATRWRPADPLVARGWGDWFWGEGRREEATDWYRWAANLDGFQESLFQSWFLACRGTRRTDAALDHLRDRFERFGRRSELPALTMAWAWLQLDRPDDARRVLEDAMARRPDDGTLRLRASAIQARLGLAEEARATLDAARGRVRESDWLRVAAELAELRMDHGGALQAWRRVLETEPLATDAHQAVWRLLARLEGDAAALAALRAAVERFPHHLALRRMLAEASRSASPAVYEATARELTMASPSDAWGRRELALALGALGRWEDGVAEARVALEIEPRSPAGWRILGSLSARSARLPEARECLRRAIALSADDVAAMGDLLGLADHDAARREELKFIREQLEIQVLTGDGLGRFREIALPVLSTAELNEVLCRAWRARPDLWQAWSTYAIQLGHEGRTAEALEVARDATRRFPHLAAVWLDLARVHRRRHEVPEEIEALERAFELSPDSGSPAMMLGDALERAGRLDDARVVYERARRLSPFDASLHGALGHVHWRLGRGEEGLAGFEHALRLWPGYSWAWATYQALATEAGQSRRIPEFARRLTAENPGDKRAWMLLAAALEAGPEHGERVAAAERAVELAPGDLEAWDFLAEVLVDAERFEDALAACRRGIAALGGASVELVGRQAWVDARRGETTAAMARMRCVLEENAGYLWGWRLLARWSMEAGDLVEAERAMDHVLRLQPGDASAWRDLAQVQLQRGQREPAKASYAEALRLDPALPGTGEPLFGLQLEDGDSRSAERTLESLRVHHPGSTTLACAARLALRRDDVDTASAALEQLCRLPDPDPWPVASVSEAFRVARKGGRALRLMKPLVGTEAANPQVAASVIALLLDRDARWEAVRVFERTRAEEEQDRAASVLAKELGALQDRNWVAWVLWRRAKVFRRTDEAWGHIGYALFTAHRHGAVVKWLSDWRRRQQVQPWMIFNLCLSLRHLGRYREAGEAAREVLQRWGHRDGASDLHLFLALEAGLAGDADRAAEHLGLVTVRQEVAHDRQLLALARTLVSVQRAEPARRTDAFADARAALASEFAPRTVLFAMRDVRRSFARTGRRLAADGAGWRCRGWFAWRLYWAQGLGLTLPPVVAVATAWPHWLWAMVAVPLLIEVTRRSEGV